MADKPMTTDAERVGERIFDWIDAAKEPPFRSVSYDAHVDRVEHDLFFATGILRAYAVCIEDLEKLPACKERCAELQEHLLRSLDAFEARKQQRNAR